MALTKDDIAQLKTMFEVMLEVKLEAKLEEKFNEKLSSIPSKKEFCNVMKNIKAIFTSFSVPQAGA